MQSRDLRRWLSEARRRGDAAPSDTKAAGRLMAHFGPLPAVVRAVELPRTRIGRVPASSDDRLDSWRGDRRAL